MKILSSQEASERFKDFQKNRNYSAMYSSILGGIVQNAENMYVPIDDHLVHRGDGIFEACRFTDNGIFLLEEHIDRLFTSAEFVSMELPWSKSEIAGICKELAKVSGLKSGQLRLFVSRGPGDFSPNPYSTVGSQLYIVATEFKKLSQALYDQGASLLVSDQPIKWGFFPRVKSCNYLQNVLLKKEAVDRKVDFIINKTPDGHIAEGPTENILFLTEDNKLLAPRFDYTLRGTTLLKVLEIAKKHQQELGIKEIGHHDLSEADLLKAKEVMMVGTTLAVLPITIINGSKKRPVGPVAKRLNLELEALF